MGKFSPSWVVEHSAAFLIFGPGGSLQKMHLSLFITLLSVFTVANCFPGGGQGHGEGFIESLGSALKSFRSPHQEGKRQLQQGQQFLAPEDYADFTLPQEVHERAPGPNAFADPNGHERFQNVHNNAQRQEVYFSTHIPGGSYYTHKAHHRPIVGSKRYKRSQNYHDLPAGAYEEHRLPKEIVERAPGPNAFADPNNGFERFQNIHNTAERQQVYFSTHDPSGSYYTMKRHHAPLDRRCATT